jgi:hypothetical protein
MKIKSINTMKKTIEVQQVAPTVVGTTNVTLPHYYVCGTYQKNYCCITEQMVLIQIRMNSVYANVDTCKYEDAEEVSARLEKDMRERLYEPVDAAVFQHKFSEIQREIFYMVNPQLKPIS